MGAYNCFRKYAIFSDKYCEYKEETQVDVDSSKNQSPEKGISKAYTKKNSIFFDKNNFINMKTRSLFEEYDVKDKLGEGAYGRVYKAQHRKTKFIRAVKAIKRKNVETTAFTNEISILKTIDHPNVIRLFECYYDANYYYMVEEYCSGGDLYDYIKRQKFFSEKKAASIISQLLSAINHLHSKKIVHRDLKPENIVLSETKSNDIFIKLIDFGTSTWLKADHLTQELGTIYYIAPEVFKNKYNEKADIWSCGIILYAMLCGHPPFRGNKEEDIKNKIIKGKLEFPGNEWCKVSPEAIAFVKDLLTYSPSSRPNAEKAVANPWLIKLLKPNSEDNILDPNIIQNLIKFTSAVILQKATLSFITNQVGQNEEIKRLKDEFDKIDVNKDGVLSKSELIECLVKIYPPQEAQRKADEVFNEIDFNNDGNINFSEFLTATMKKERLFSEEMLKKAFNMFDIDGNGYITIEELKETIPMEITSPSDWEEIVNEVDFDGDGQISFDEFKFMMEKLNNKF